MSLVFPAAAMFALIFLVGLYAVSVRVRYARSGKVRLGYFKTMDAKAYDAPEYLVRVGRHYDNLMQLPLLYFATIAIALALNVESALAQAAAWTFVVSRVAHSYVHLGSNHVLQRMFAFLLGWLCLVAMWIAILIR